MIGGWQWLKNFLLFPTQIIIHLSVRYYQRYGFNTQPEAVRDSNTKFSFAFTLFLQVKLVMMIEYVITELNIESGYELYKF